MIANPLLGPGYRWRGLHMPGRPGLRRHMLVPLPAAPEAACHCPHCFARQDAQEPRHDR